MYLVMTAEGVVPQVFASPVEAAEYLQTMGFHPVLPDCWGDAKQGDRIAAGAGFEIVKACMFPDDLEKEEQANRLVLDLTYLNSCDVHLVSTFAGAMARQRR